MNKGNHFLILLLLLFACESPHHTRSVLLDGKIDLEEWEDAREITIDE